MHCPQREQSATRISRFLETSTVVLAPVEKIVTAFRRMGIDYVFDTTFSADLTIMEEGSEFVKRLQDGDLEEYPMFTSCCPGWVRFIKTQYPDMIGRLSTAKSPQQMFGAVMKTYFAKKLGVDPERIFTLSIMPCLAKKAEREMDLFYEEYAGHDIDCVLTTRELDRMLRAEHLNPQFLEEGEFDSPFEVGTGAGVIFGATGGVMEAALRSAYFLVTGENPDADAFHEIRGVKRQGWTEAEFDVAGNVIQGDIGLIVFMDEGEHLPNPFLILPDCCMCRFRVRAAV